MITTKTTAGTLLKGVVNKHPNMLKQPTEDESAMNLAFEFIDSLGGNFLVRWHEWLQQRAESEQK